MRLFNDATKQWLSTARLDHIVKRSAKVSMVVGSILVAINQGDVLLSGQVGSELLWKIPLTYTVPYAVSTYASVDAIRRT